MSSGIDAMRTPSAMCESAVAASVCTFDGMLTARNLIKCGGRFLFTIHSNRPTISGAAPRRSFTPQTYAPQPSADWDAAYARLEALVAA